MAAVTNKESHMPLSSFMFKYKHRLWRISVGYFQLSGVNLYLLTFCGWIDACSPYPHHPPTPHSLIDIFFLIFQAPLYFRGKGGGGDHKSFIQLLCRCIRLRLPQGTAKSLTELFSVVNKNKRLSGRTFVLKRSCSASKRVIPFSNGALICADERLVGFARCR